MTPQAGQVVWITGASSGLGRALALKMAAEGWRVAASARNAEALSALQEDGPDGRIRAFPLDVTDRVALSAALGEIRDALGPIDQVVLNAGTHEPLSAQDFDPALFERLIRLNLTATIDCLAAVLPDLRTRGRGRIALVASVAGYRGLPTAAAYGMTKAGLITMAEALRPELEREGIILQIVNPGFVKTPLTDKNSFPMPFLMDVDKAAAAFYKGLQSDRFEIAFPWRMAALMKLYRLLPYSLALALSRRMLP